MADLSLSFNPESIAANSAAASDAGSKAVVAISDASDAGSAASDAGSKAVVAGSDASDAQSAASDAGSKASIALAKIAASSANWNKGSDASSKASEALSKIAASSANWNKASDASSTASEALSRIVARSAVWDTKTVVLKPMAEDEVVVTGDDLMRFTVPVELNGMDLVTVGAHVYTAPTSNSITIDIFNITSAVDMLTSAMKIDATESDTITATSTAVINTGADNVVTAEEIRLDVTAGASGASGLEVRLGFR